MEDAARLLLLLVLNTTSTIYHTTVPAVVHIIGLTAWELPWPLATSTRTSGQRYGWSTQSSLRWPQSPSWLALPLDDCESCASVQMTGSSAWLCSGTGYYTGYLWGVRTPPTARILCEY